MDPLVYINDLDLFTLPLSLRNFADAYGLPVWDRQFAATSLSVVPISWRARWSDSTEEPCVASSILALGAGLQTCAVMWGD